MKKNKYRIWCSLIRREEREGRRKYKAYEEEKKKLEIGKKER